MKRIALQIFCVLIFVFLAGCGSSDQPASQTEKSEKTVFDPMVDAMDRAKRIEQLSKDRKQQLDQQLEEDGAPPPRHETQ